VLHDVAEQEIDPATRICACGAPRHARSSARGRSGSIAIGSAGAIWRRAGEVLGIRRSRAARARHDQAGDGRQQHPEHAVDILVRIARTRAAAGGLACR